MPASRRVRRVQTRRPVRTSGNLLVNGPAAWWPGGGESPVTSMACGCGGSGCGNCAMVWDAGPGQGQAVGGLYGIHGYGYGAIGPNGPDRGNLPGRLPEGRWWSEGMGVPPAFTRCMQLIVNAVVRTRWKVTTNGDPNPSFDLPPWIYAPMLAGKVPGPDMPVFPSGRRFNSHDFWSSIMFQTVAYGRAAMIYERNFDGQPKAGTLRQLNPFLIDVDDTGHWVVDAFGDEPLRTDFDGGFSVGGREWQLRVFRNFAPHLDARDDFAGGVLIRHSETFGLALKIESAARNIFHSGVPAGILKTTNTQLTADEAQRLKQAWVDAHGSGDRRGIAVLNASTEFSPISWSAQELELGEVRKATAQDIAFAFGLDPGYALGIGDGSLTYSTLQERSAANTRDTLAGYAASLMEVFTTILPAGQRLEVDWESYQAPTWSQQVSDVAMLHEKGLLTVDEARQRLGYGPMPVAPVPPQLQDDQADPMAMEE